MIIAAVTLLMSISAIAQTPANADNDSIQCRRNTAFAKTYAKSGNYDDAYDFWKKAYGICPDSSKDIYILGALILNWKIENAKTDEDKQKYFDELMSMYDDRIKYFGNDDRTGIDYILGNKASDYIKYKQNKADFNLLYDWLKPVVNEKKSSTDAVALSIYLYSSMKKMMEKPEHKEQYIADYVMVSGFFDEAIRTATEAGDENTAEFYKENKMSTDTHFAASGAADCETVAKIFGPKLDDNKDNKDYLEMIMKLLVSLKCNDNPVYYKAAEYNYAITPSVSGAVGIARQAFSKKDYDKANKFYEEAIKLSTKPEERSEVYYNMATMAYEQKQFGRARQFCMKSMEERPNFGTPMLLIATMYAATAPSIYPSDPVMQQIVYCLVVDKAMRAKSIDPSISDDANKLIGMYSRYFPRKEDVFLHPDLTEGQSFTVGGWIGETTTIRVTH